MHFSQVIPDLLACGLDNIKYGRNIIDERINGNFFHRSAHSVRNPSKSFQK